VEATRPDWKQQLDWCETLLKEYKVNNAALAEINLLKDFFCKLPQTSTNYGLVHYDFEAQNVFYDSKTKEFCPIDFDDSIYHWFIIDIDRSIRAIKNTLAKKYCDSAIANFLSGYRSEAEITDDELALSPVFKRYCDLFGYTRRLRTLHDKWENEPEWMVELRNKLTAELSDKVSCFGKKIEF
jgi:Ser/Thr protein kinase RdoA (MazF antagonist)